MRAVVLHEYGGPEKLKFEDNVPEPQISGSTVAILRQCCGYDVDPDMPVFENCHCDGYGSLFDEWHQFDEHGLPFLYCMSPVND